MNHPQPILLLEVNEVPWRILNHFASRFSNIKSFFNRAVTFSTLAENERELSPWVTWPAFHRGLSNSEHNILNLGQDTSTFRGKTIWDEYLERGHNVGVFGSMQSWPAKDPGPGGFYVPDTFAHDAKCIPAYLEPLQKFNLDFVSRSGRVASKFPWGSAFKPSLAVSIVRSGIRPGTLLRCLGQLLAESRDSNLVARRPIFQTILFWDAFRKLYDAKQPPALATFFTNHVAGVMHRYWHHLFPEDFPEEFRPSKRVHDKTIEFALSVVDEILGDVLQWMNVNPNLTVIFATSMGQEAVLRQAHHGYEAVVKDVPKLMRSIGLKDDEFQPLLAMVPQIAVSIGDPAIRARAKNALELIITDSGHRFFSVEAIGNSLSISLRNPSAEDCTRALVKFSDQSLSSFADIGVKVWRTDAGSAYHIPEGVMAVTGPRQSVFSNQSDPLPVIQVKSKLMAAAGLTQSPELSH